MRLGLGLLLVLQLQDAPKEDSRRLLPLVAGNKWNYDDGSTMKVLRKIKPKEEEMFVIEFKTKAFKETLHWQVVDSGIKEYFYRMETDKEVVEIPAKDPIFKVVFPPEAGRQWELRLLDAKNNKVLKVTEILPREDVEVPAGKFNAVPVKLTVKVNDKATEELTLWYAKDVGIVKRHYSDLVKKKEETQKLDKYDVKLPAEVTAPAADPAAVNKDIQAGLKGFLDRAAGDPESVNVLGQLLLNLVGPDDAVQKSEEEARKKIYTAKGKPADMDSNLYAALQAWGKSMLPPCNAAARDQKDPLEWQLKGMMLKYANQHIKALKILNEHRQSCGLASVSWDYKLAHGTLLHARYLALTGYANVKKGADFHTELKDSPYYTEEGKQAGGCSVVSSGGAERSVSEWIWSFYHRLGLLSPSLKRTGSGMWEEGIDLMSPSCMDVLRGREGDSSMTMVLYPAPDQTGVNPKFSQMGELPNPVPGQDNKTFGQPITILFLAGTPSNITARLMKDDKEVPFWLHTPEKPSNPEEDRKNVVCLMPKAHLSGGSKYTVRFSGKLGGQDWSKEWSFTTK